MKFEFKGKTFEAEEIKGILVFEGDVNVDSLKLESLLELPWASKPWIVKGNFSCYNNNLTSLKGAPKSVEENFDCSQNKLENLKGSPKSVGRGFICHYNKLTSLGLTDIPKWEGHIISDNGQIIEWIKELINEETAILNISHPHNQIRKICQEYLEGG